MKQYSVKDLNRTMRQYGATLREREYWQERLEEIHVDCLGNSSWDQQFWMTIWLTGGKGICPNSNLSTNIGFDDLGTHTTDPNNVGSCRPLEPILPLIEPTDTSVQRKADLLFHKTYVYGWSGFKRIPHRLNTCVKRFFGYKGSWRKIFSKKMLTICLFALFFSNALALNVVFRFDDPRLVEDPITLRVLQLFEERECPITLAIIAADTIESPVMPTTINDSLYVSKLNSTNVEIALHGLTHKDIDGCGEFGLVDYNEAYRKIYKGKYLLGNYINDDIITFIPPYNAINNSTLCAMVENQLFILSADMTSEVYVEGIQFYPETLGDLIRTNGLWNAAKYTILHCNNDDAICVIMFHAYDLQNEDSWNKLGALLDYCQGDKNIKLHTFSSLYESGNSSSFYRIKANQLRSLLRKYVLNYGVLYPTWLCWLVHIINALLHSAIPFLILIGLLKNNATYVWGIILITSIAYFMFAYFQLITPLKLLFGCLVLVLIISSIILICNCSKK